MRSSTDKEAWDFREGKETKIYWAPIWHCIIYFVTKIKREKRIRKASWEKLLWADDMAGQKPGKAEPRSPTANGHSRPQVLVPNVVSTHLTESGDEGREGRWSWDWGFIWFISTCKDIKKRQRTDWEANMDVLVRQDERIKGYWLRWWRGKKWKTRERVGGKKLLRVLLVVFISLSPLLSSHFMKTILLLSPSNVSSRRLCFGHWPAPRSIPGT